jgi:hypothetical protein
MAPEAREGATLAHGRWIQEATLRLLFEQGYSYDEIARVNFEAVGWRPTRSAVAKKRERLKVPTRRPRRADLVPWYVASAHHSSPFRHMLAAESRLRAGIPQTDSDRSLTERLHRILFGRGMAFVVCYHPHPKIGFYLSERNNLDVDIIRPGTIALDDDDAGHEKVSEQVIRDPATGRSGDVSPALAQPDRVDGCRRT